MNPMALSFLLLFGYHNVLSPFLPAACRFYPTCSAYTEQAIQKHGIFKGILPSLRIAPLSPRPSRWLRSGELISIHG